MPEASTAAPPAEAPTITSAPPVSTAQANDLSEPFSALEAISLPGNLPKPEPKKEAPKPEPDKKAAPAKPDKVPPQRLPGKQDDKAVTDPAKEPEKAVDKSADKAEPEPEKPRKTPWQLVHEHERTIKDLRQQLEDKSKPVDDPEKKALTESKTQYEKRIKELETELEFSSFERSDKYKQEYEEPYVNSFLAGRAKAASLKFPDGNGGSRPGTEQDFDSLMRITNDDEAAEKAVELFGNKAPVMLYHRERAQELNAARTKALSEYQKKGDERMKELGEKQTQTQKQREDFEAGLAKVFHESRKSAIDKYEWFRPKDGQEKRNELLEKGMELVDRAFSDGQPLKEGQKPLDHTSLAKVRAAMANKAAGFDALALEHSEALAKIKELEASLGQYQESEPKNGDGKGKTVPAESDDLQGALARLGQKARPG